MSLDFLEVFPDNRIIKVPSLARKDRNMRKHRLLVEVHSVRNLCSAQSALMDVYAIVKIKYAADSAKCMPFRTETVTCSEREKINFGFAMEFDIDWDAMKGTLCIELYNECSFCFDMFPEDDAGYQTLYESHYRSESLSSVVTRSCSEGSLDSCDSEYCFVESCDVMDRCTQERPDENLEEGRTLCLKEISRRESESDGDQKLGSLELPLKDLCGENRVNDRWYSLDVPRYSGQIRLRTQFSYRRHKMQTKSQASNNVAEAMTWAISSRFKDKRISEAELQRREQLKLKDLQLRSYMECREKQREAIWQIKFGTIEDLEQLIQSRSVSKDTLQNLVRETGVPQLWRKVIYKYFTDHKRTSEDQNYYQRLAIDTERLDSVAFRQIEMDVDRTFGHSIGGLHERKDSLRRVLKAYSLRNKAIGYCQGLNFLVAFFLSSYSEEIAFWLLATLCEVYFPEYYTPTMTGTQTDMRVLKDILMEYLPQLDEFALDVGLPLELLGSQWFICLFTTTFSSDVAHRIMDLVLSEGSYVVFPVILHHLRRLEPQLLDLNEFQCILQCIKAEERLTLDADDFMHGAMQEAQVLTKEKIEELRKQHRNCVQQGFDRLAQAQAVTQQVASVCHFPAFSTIAADLLRFFHDGTDTSKSEVAVLLSIVCHSLAWLTDQSKRLHAS